MLIIYDIIWDEVKTSIKIGQEPFGLYQWDEI